MNSTMTIIAGATSTEMEIAVKAILEERDRQIKQAKIHELEKSLNATLSAIYDLGGRVVLQGSGYLHYGAELKPNGKCSSIVGTWTVKI